MYLQHRCIPCSHFMQGETVRLGLIWSPDALIHLWPHSSILDGWNIIIDGRKRMSCHFIYANNYLQCFTCSQMQITQILHHMLGKGEGGSMISIDHLMHQRPLINGHQWVQTFWFYQNVWNQHRQQLMMQDESFFLALCTLPLRSARCHMIMLANIYCGCILPLLRLKMHHKHIYCGCILPLLELKMHHIELMILTSMQTYHLPLMLCG